MSTTSTISIRPPVSIRSDYQSRSRWGFMLLLNNLLLMIDRRRQRQALADLAENKHLLDDIGLTRERALREAHKSFWH